MISASESRLTRPAASCRWVAFVVINLVLPGVASGQDAIAPDPQQQQELEQEALKRAAARDLALQAADAFDAARYEEALDRFSRAQALYPAPTLSIMEGRCLVALGRWLEGFEKFNQTARTELPPDAPPPFVQAVAEARAAAEDLDKRLPRVEIRVPADVSVAVDGVALPEALYDIAHPINPGVHRLTASVDGKGYHEEIFEVAERELKVVQVAVPLQPHAVPVAPPKPSPEPSAEGTHHPTPGWLMPTAFAVGGAGAVGAIGSLFLAGSAKSDLDEVCSPGCPESAADDLERFRTYRTAFFVSAAVGVVGTGVGLYLVLGDDSESQTTMRVSPTGASLSTRF